MGALPHWLMYVAVPDVDAAVRLAIDMGGSVFVQPEDIPTVGRFAVLADAQGATFAVFRPVAEGMGADEPAPGDFSWHELAAGDWRDAWDFYAALFGWEHTSSFEMGPGDTYWMFGRGGVPLGGMYRKRPDVIGPAHWLSYINVRSADAAAQRALRLGGTIVQPPMEVPGGDRIAVGVDPQGAAFALHQLAARAAPKRPAAKKPRTVKAKKKAAKPKATKRKKAR